MNLHKFVYFGYIWICVSCLFLLGNFLFFVNGFLIWVISCFFCEWVSDSAPPKPQPKRYSLSFVMFKFEPENGSNLCFWHLGFEKTVSF